MTAARAAGGKAAVAPPVPVTQTLAVAAIAGALFFSPYMSWRPADILFTLSDTLFCLGLLLLLAGGGLRLNPFGNMTPIWLAALGVMLGALFVSSMINGDPTRWVIVAGQYLFAMLIVPMLVIGHPMRTLAVFGCAQLAGVVAMEAFGIGVYFFWDADYWTIRETLGVDFITGGRRLGAFLGDANWNAIACAMNLPLAAYLMKTRVIPAWAGVIAMAVLLLAVLLTASFTGFTSTVIALAIFTVVARAWPSPWWFLLAGIAVVVVLASGVGLPQAFEARVANALQSGDVTAAGTYVGRAELMKEAWGIAEQTLLVGLGVDQFRVISVQRAPVHNMYLLMWTEGGLLALIGYLLMLTLLLLAILARVGRDRAAAGLGLAVLSTLLIASNAAPHMYSRTWIAPVALALAFVFAQHPRQSGMNGNGRLIR